MSTFLQSASVDTGSAGATLGKAYVTQNLTSGSSLVADCYWQSGSATCAVADPTNGSWTALGSPLRGTGNLNGFSCQAFLFTANTSTAKPTVTMTVSGSVALKGIAIHEYSGSLALEGSASYGMKIGTTPACGPITPALSTDIVHSFVLADFDIVSVASPFTARESANFGLNMSCDDVSPTGGVAVTATYTANASESDTASCIFVLTPPSSTTNPKTLTASQAQAPSVPKVVGKILVP